MKQETKLGFFVLLGVAIFVTSIILLGDFQFQSRYYLNILFGDVAGLPVKAKVKIAGVEVGAVKDITLEGDKAKVRIWLKSNIKIRKNARAGIVSTGIIGSKYLELTMGSKPFEFFKNEDVFDGVDPVQLDKMISNATQQLNELVQSLKSYSGKSPGETIGEILENIRLTSRSLKTIVSEHENNFVNIVKNIENATSDISDITSENKDDIRSVIASMKNVSQNLNAILAKIESGEGMLGKIVNDKEMGEDLKTAVVEIKETIKETKKVMRRLNLIETDWDYTMRYDSKNDVYRSDVGLRIYPVPDKFYYIGVSNLGDSSVVTTDPEKINTINLMLGKRWKPLEIYGGIMRSKGGVGARIKPFWRFEPWRRVEITAEAYDFPRKIPVAKANVNLGARVELLPWAFVGAQVEDTFNTSSINSYVNLVARDDDIAYLLGLVGLAKP
ncbi:MAG: MlaD family protein [Endomicrobiales bacterium]|nr:MlaD family protein [Endomicrobiales bacterium]